ncbi:ABC transporter permease, partial [candidate division KSB1 bacterium]
GKVFEFVPFVPGTLSLIKTTWKKIVPDAPFRYSFLDEDLFNQYSTEQRWRRIVTYASMISILIAALGLFGLTAIAAARRTKEIGVRKVLGASVSNIFILVSKEFIYLVIISNLIAWPAAYFVMQKWMQNFAYNTGISVIAFAVSSIITIAAALLTVSFQAVKVSVKNPVESLKYE